MTRDGRSGSINGIFEDIRGDSVDRDDRDIDRDGRDGVIMIATRSSRRGRHRDGIGGTA